MNKKALSPIMATLLLVVFALIIGTITMSWGKKYVEQISEEEPTREFGSDSYIIKKAQINTPLKELQIKYILGKITKEQYLQQEKNII